MKRFSSVALALTLLVLSGCGGETVPPGPEESDAPPAENTEVLPPEVSPLSAEESLLQEMTLEEKVGQLFFPRVPEQNALEDVSAFHLGGYILFGRDTQEKTANDLIQTIAAWQAAAEIPLLIGVDEEGGTVVRLSSNSHLRSKKFPGPKKLWEQGVDVTAADTHEKDLLLRALGFNVNLAPVADVSMNPGDFIYERTTGGDAETARAYVSTVVKMMAQDGIGSVLKHFPGYGGSRDTHTGTAVDSRDMDVFWSSDFLPFQAGMAAGGEKTAILVSHNIVTSMDPNFPASLSPAVHQILREDLGYDGVIMTDDLIMKAVQDCVGEGSAAVMALQAGNDLLITLDYRTEISEVLAAVDSGELSEEAVDSACLRVLRWKAALGLLCPVE